MIRTGDRFPKGYLYPRFLNGNETPPGYSGLIRIGQCQYLLHALLEYGSRRFTAALTLLNQNCYYKAGL